MDHRDFSIKINDNNPHAFCIIRVELDEAGEPVDWTFIYCNDKLAALEGKAMDELLGRRFYRDLFPDGKRVWLKPYYEAAYLGKASEFEESSPEIGRYLSIKAFPAGERGYCAVVIKDIKEDVVLRARLAGELEEAQEAMDMLHKSIGSGAWYYSYNSANELVRVRYSSAFRKLLGYEDRSEFADTGEALRDVVHPADRERVHRCYRDAVEDPTDRTKCDVEFRCLTKERGYRWFRATASIKRRQDGTAKTAFGMFVDIDDKKSVDEQLCEALDRAERASQAKTDFLRHMSHDIRTPLNGITGLLALGDFHPDDVELLAEERRKAKVAVKYLLSLVNSVLDISKLEDGSRAREERAFDLEELLVEDVDVIKEQMMELKLNFTGGRDCINIKHRHLLGNKAYLNHILMNIAGNAVKFNRKHGSVTMTAEELSCDGEVAVYRFICADTGMGMSQEFQQRMFEPFAQEGKVTRTSYMGSGLGLSFVKSMVDQLGGTLECESQEGVGTKFTVTLSFKVDRSYEERRARKAAAESRIKEADLKGLKVLLVEDNELNMEIAHMLLAHEGAVVEEATNGQEAVEMFAASEMGHYDIIFMDIMMPVMDGLEATRQIRALDRPDAKAVTIIATSANAFQEDVEQCLAAGMNAHCAKPIEVSRVKKAIWQLQQE